MVGGAEDDVCECGVAQNAAHLLESPKVGYGRGIMMEQVWRDPEWCREVVRVLRR